MTNEQHSSHEDVLSASVLRDGQLIKSVGGIRLDNGRSESLGAAFGEAFGTASSLTRGAKLKLEISGGADGLTASTESPPPFSGSSTAPVGSGGYTLTLGTAVPGPPATLPRPRGSSSVG